MKSTLENNEPIYIRCECGSSHHHLCFDYDTEFWAEDEMGVAFVATKSGFFWHRVRNAWKHVFGREDLVLADIIIKREQLRKLLDD
jgi:hypothetical protein